MKEEFKTWKEVPTTSRSLEQYFFDLNLTADMLEGKKVLDIGSGTGRFAKELKEAGINAEVISLDPVFAAPEEKSRIQGDISGKLYRKLIQETNIPEVKKKTVAGVGEELPFRDNTFDLIIANKSLPAYGTKPQIDQFFSEVFRVLKNDGEFRSSPSQNTFRRGKKYPLDKDLENILRKFELSKEFKIIKKVNHISLMVLKKIVQESVIKSKISASS